MVDQPQPMQTHRPDRPRTDDIRAVVAFLQKEAAQLRDSVPIHRDLANRLQDAAFAAYWRKTALQKEVAAEQFERVAAWIARP